MCVKNVKHTKVTCLVLDECDTLVENIKQFEALQVHLFSASLSDSLKGLSDSFLVNPAI